ncbi:unnamed protein product [Pleuronectes platessa]|uniref:Uncharacterized protein n=1 Tax=Pleuronectes platessa TaxID=8262 RepID=A0A9N7TJJ1_PLEPL|nr:unnamed protein product [Pleuronectes platessa]
MKFRSRQYLQEENNSSTEAIKAELPEPASPSVCAGRSPGVLRAAVGAQSTLQDAMGSHRGSATVMPITTLEARLVAGDVERGLCGFVWGSWSAGEEKDLQRDLPGPEKGKNGARVGWGCRMPRPLVPSRPGLHSQSLALTHALNQTQAPTATSVTQEADTGA